MFNAAKDALTSQAAKAFVNQRIARYGEVRTLRIDSRKKTIEVVCQLHGESEPISVRVENYELHEAGGRKLLRLGSGSFTSNRPWLQNLLTDLARDREIPVPAWAASAL